MGCSSRIAQILLFVFNFILVVAGLALLIVGILTTLNFNDIVPEEFSASISAAPIISIVLGVLIFFIAFLGCCGAMKKSKCMLILYAVIIGCVLVVQIVAGAYALSIIKEGDGRVQSEINKLVDEAMKHYQDNNGMAKEYIDNVQQKLECCGVFGPSDWNGPPPTSCFEDNDSDKKRFDSGCAGPIFDEMVKLSGIIGYVALGLCATEVLTIIFALCLIC